MARSFNGTNQYLTASYPVTSTPLTIAAWFNADSLTGSIALYVGNNLTANGWWLGIGADGHVEATALSGDLASYSQAETTISHTPGNWHHACAVFDSATSRTAYIDGGGAATDTVSITPAAPINSVTIGAGRAGTGPLGFYPGRLAEFGVWDVGLTAAEVASLARGISPLYIRPQNLISYWPLIGRASPDLELINGLSVSVVNSPPAADHCRIIYPASGFSAALAVAPVSSIELTPPLVVNSFQVFAPSISVEGGPSTLSPPVVSNSFQVFAPTVTVLPYTPVVGDSSFADGYLDVASNLLMAANNAGAALNSAINAADVPPFTITLFGDLSQFTTSGALTIDVAHSTSIPLFGDLSQFTTSGALTIDVAHSTSSLSSEIFYFDGKSGQEITITARAQDGTTAKAFAIGAQAQMRHIARHHNLLAETIIDIEEAVFEKANAVHTHTIADTSGLQAALDSKVDQTAVDARVAKTGDIMSGLLTLSGAPTADLHAATKLYVDSLYVSAGSYNAKLYGLAGNGSTDDTTALQALVDLVGNAGGGKIYFPRGVYLIGGALQDPGGSNAQIVLPLKSDQTSPTTIDFCGETTPPTWLWEGGPPTGAGYSIIKSTLTGGTGTASLIGGKKHASSALSNMVMPNFRDLVFETQPNSTITVLNLIEQTGNRIEHVLIHDGSIQEIQDEPTHSNSYGVKLPPTNHSSRIYLDTLHVIGFYTGVLLGELTQGSILAQGCMRAVEVPFCHHPSMLDMIGSYGCAIDIYASGAGDRALYIELLSLQNDLGYGQPWQASVANVYDPSNVIRGRFNWSNVQAAVGVIHTLIKNGGINFIGTELW